MNDQPIIPAALASRLACALDGHPLRAFLTNERSPEDKEIAALLREFPTLWPEVET